MEKYPARDDRPKAASEADVSHCDIYIGTFAWRYGHVPGEDNPENKSITELEYLAVARAKKPQLIFLLADDAPWSSSLRAAEQQKDDGKQIRYLRNRLKAERWAAFFKSPDDLAKQVLKSVFQLESTKRVESMEAINQSELQNSAHPFSQKSKSRSRNRARPNLLSCALVRRPGGTRDYTLQRRWVRLYRNPPVRPRGHRGSLSNHGSSH